MTKILHLDEEDKDLLLYILTMEISRIKGRMKENLSSEGGLSANEFLQEKLDRRVTLKANIEEQIK